MSRPHKFRKSVKYNSRRGCPSGFHKRSSYTVKSTGRYVPSRCVRSTTQYEESQKEFRQRLASRATRRLNRSVAASRARQNISGENDISCPEGMIPRKGYVRHFRNTVRREGYEQVRRGKVVKVKPIAHNIYVKPGCIQNRGMPGKGADMGRPLIGPLREGELKKYGYSSDQSLPERHESLSRAMKEFGALGVFRKLDAVAKLTSRTAPEASRKFSEDRDWIRAHHDLTAF